MPDSDTWMGFARSVISKWSLTPECEREASEMQGLVSASKRQFLMAVPRTDARAGSLHVGKLAWTGKLRADYLNAWSPEVVDEPLDDSPIASGEHGGGP
jgi:hypothetical protein